MSSTITPRERNRPDPSACSVTFHPPSPTRITLPADTTTTPATAAVISPTTTTNISITTTGNTSARFNTITAYLPREVNGKMKKPQSVTLVRPLPLSYSKMSCGPPTEPIERPGQMVKTRPKR
eukprot:TRINITY_DN6873_c0_g2_i1.p1 TRINITY_DN6873_c0_g2~~TRINITY_DN6873_c0_g2_i1.p1  ORF type:complete len:123 (+),score=14.90 TRINITY_DN6873_c0_g2_i1:225-593(+)